MLAKARVISRDAQLEAAAAGEPVPQTIRAPHAGDAVGVSRKLAARLVPRERLEAAAQAEALLAAARAEAEATRQAAVEEARAYVEAEVTRAREAELAKLAGAHLRLAQDAQAFLGAQVDRMVQVAVLLAERIVDREVTQDPTLFRALASQAISETRGARRIRISVHSADMAALGALLGDVGLVADVVADDQLSRGSVVLGTDLGTVDGTVRAQLTHLGAALRAPLLQELQRP
jgi:flagellar biosynthesis/type III secretory pathway protein FliH